MKVVHLSPTYFSQDSIIGGGERFAEELARAMSQRVDVKFVSFGRQTQRQRVSPTYERVILHNWTRSLMTPLSPLLLRALSGASVIHCHQYFVLPTFLACIYGAVTRTPVFVSDLGGGGWTPAYQIDQSRWICGHLPISQYATQLLAGKNKKHRVIYAGVDPQRYSMRARLDHDRSVLFLGRILPNKGIHVLIEGLPDDMRLNILGTESDATYLETLKERASGKGVHFHGRLSDGEVIRFLQTAMVLVLPTPVDARGSAGVNELFGLALVEAMACGCPVIASRTASLPEIVNHGENGLLVAPNSPEEINAALRWLSADTRPWRRLALAARATVEARFTWEAVAANCLAAYSEWAPAGNE